MTTRRLDRDDIHLAQLGIIMDGEHVEFDEVEDDTSDLQDQINRLNNDLREKDHRHLLLARRADTYRNELETLKASRPVINDEFKNEIKEVWREACIAQEHDGVMEFLSATFGILGEKDEEEVFEEQLIEASSYDEPNPYEGTEGYNHGNEVDDYYDPEEEEYWAGDGDDEEESSWVERTAEELQRETELEARRLRRRQSINAWSTPAVTGWDARGWDTE